MDLGFFISGFNSMHATVLGGRKGVLISEVSLLDPILLSEVERGIFREGFHCNIVCCCHRVPVRAIGFGNFEIQVDAKCNCSCETKEVCH